MHIFLVVVERLECNFNFLTQTNNIGHLFAPIERAICQHFLPIGPGEMRELLAQGVKQAGLGIRNPVDCAQA